MTKVIATSVRDSFSETLNRVAFKGDRIVLERHGKPVAALVSVEDLELLEELEDRFDVEAVRAAREEPRDVPCEEIGEEIANSVSHGVGFLAALAATPLLVLAAARRGGAAAIVGASVFAGTVAVLYLASTLYHALPTNKAKRLFRVLDHSAIFLLIAGTYTPFTLGVLRGAWGWTLFGVVWGLAVVGVTLKSVGGIRYPRLSTALYAGMGWLALVAIRPLWLHVPVAGWLWLIAGGLAYTAGIAFYVAERVRYGHFVWHVFVLIGTACHFFAVLWYAA